ncbi:hypothetical protein VE00_08320 [Pseudogymnoascus sp. WSF 3629]|nr:hypothetical protein VE00_08320 [Pseudogymnoascus sp. WSF 3629]
MAATDDVCDVSDDMDTLTVMNEDGELEASSSNDVRYQRDVQEIRPRFDEESQMAISARLTALHSIGRFDTKAILQIKVRQVVKELLKRISDLKHNRHQLRLRSRRLMRRLSGRLFVPTGGGKFVFAEC